MAIPSGGFSLGQTSQRFVFGISGSSSPFNKAMIICATRSDRGGHPGSAKSTSITSVSGLILLSNLGTPSLGIIPSSL